MLIVIQKKKKSKFFCDNSQYILRSTKNIHCFKRVNNYQAGLGNNMSTNLSGITIGPADLTVQRGAVMGGGAKFHLVNDQRTETMVGELKSPQRGKKSLRWGTKWAGGGTKFRPAGHPRSTLRH